MIRLPLVYHWLEDDQFHSLLTDRLWDICLVYPHKFSRENMCLMAILGGGCRETFQQELKLLGRHFPGGRMISVSLTDFMNNMAISISNRSVIHHHHHPSHFNNLTVSSLRTNFDNSQHTGISYTLDTYVLISYPWLTQPIGIVILTLIFLLATILRNRRSGTRAWKDSSLATLAGLDSEVRQKLGPLRHVDTMNEKAKNTAVVMRRGGWRERWQLESKEGEGKGETAGVSVMFPQKGGVAWNNEDLQDSLQTFLPCGSGLRRPHT